MKRKRAYTTQEVAAAVDHSLFRDRDIEKLQSKLKAFQRAAILADLEQRMVERKSKKGEITMFSVASWRRIERKQQRQLAALQTTNDFEKSFSDLQEISNKMDKLIERAGATLADTKI